MAAMALWAMAMAGCATTDYRQATSASQSFVRVQPDGTGKVTWVTTVDEQTVRSVRVTTSPMGNVSATLDGAPQVSHHERLWLCTGKGDGDRPLCVQPDWQAVKDGTPPP